MINKKIAIYVLLLFITPLYASLRLRRNMYTLNITYNVFGLNPKQYICAYDDIAKQVVCEPKDITDPYANDIQVFRNVYVRKLTSDPVGIGYIGYFQNPNLNAGPPHEYTSTRTIFPFEVYASKY